MAEQRQTDEARRDILAAIRRHLAASAPFDAAHEEHHARHEGERAGGATSASRPQGVSALDAFRASVEAVVGHCVVVGDEAEASDVVRQVIGHHGARRVAVTDSPLVRAVVAQAKTDAEFIEGADAATLFGCDMGVTGAQWGVAETGTLVLESEGERHRLASLVPPVHVALLEAGRIRRTLAEVLKAVSEGGAQSLSRTVTFITGPSRTSDIELTLAIGVHGPGELYVIIIEGEGDG